MRTVRNAHAMAYFVAALIGGAALVFNPVNAVAAECTIKCEKCTCNLNTGICDCTNCTIEGCKVQPN